MCGFDNHGSQILKAQMDEGLSGCLFVVIKCPRSSLGWEAGWSHCILTQEADMEPEVWRPEAQPSDLLLLLRFNFLKGSSTLSNSIPNR